MRAARPSPRRSCTPAAPTRNSYWFEHVRDAPSLAAKRAADLPPVRSAALLAFVQAVIASENKHSAVRSGQRGRRRQLGLQDLPSTWRPALGLGQQEVQLLWLRRVRLAKAPITLRLRPRRADVHRLEPGRRLQSCRRRPAPAATAAAAARFGAVDDDPRRRPLHPLPRRVHGDRRPQRVRRVGRERPAGRARGAVRHRAWATARTPMAPNAVSAAGKWPSPAAVRGARPRAIHCARFLHAQLTRPSARLVAPGELLTRISNQGIIGIWLTLPGDSTGNRGAPPPPPPAPSPSPSPPPSHSNPPRLQACALRTSPRTRTAPSTSARRCRARRAATRRRACRSFTRRAPSTRRRRRTWRACAPPARPPAAARLPRRRRRRRRPPPPPPPPPPPRFAPPRPAQERAIDPVRPSSRHAANTCASAWDAPPVGRSQVQPSERPAARRFGVRR